LHRDYDDIISRLGEPLWYDSSGVPRYEPFTPALCDVYAWVAALNEIKCQDCGKIFKVSIELSTSNVSPEDLPGDMEALGQHLHYGDPPRHNCRPGDSMNSIPQRILEYWYRIHGPNMRWIQVPSLAGLNIMPKWAQRETDSREDKTR